MSAARDLAVAHAEVLMRRQMTPTERAVFCAHIPGDDPVELHPVRQARRLSFASKHSTPGTKGGQLHSAVELERDAVVMAGAVAICAAIPIGIAIAKGLAAASIWIGETYAVQLFTALPPA